MIALFLAVSHRYPTTFTFLLWIAVLLTLNIMACTLTVIPHWIEVIAEHYTHTHIHLTALFPGLPGWVSTRKVTPIWIFVKQETASGSGISWAICKSAHRSRQITTPAPHHSVFTGQMPFLPPNQQRQSTEGRTLIGSYALLVKREPSSCYLMTRTVQNRFKHPQTRCSYCPHCCIKICFGRMLWRKVMIHWCRLYCIAEFWEVSATVADCHAALWTTSIISNSQDSRSDRSYSRGLFITVVISDELQ